LGLTITLPMPECPMGLCSWPTVIPAFVAAVMVIMVVASFMAHAVAVAP
jgi:hypothetical protein